MDKSLIKGDLDTIGLFIVVAIINAFLVNILKVEIPIFSLILLSILFFLFKKNNLNSISVIIYFYTAVFSLGLALIYSIMGPVSEVKEVVYHINFALMLFIIVALFSSGLISEESDSSVFFWLITIYTLSSITVYFFYWESLGHIFSRHPLLFDLKMDGSINRMYGFLFNPLTQAFSFLYLFFYLYLKSYNNKIIYFLISLVIIFSFVRTAIAIFILFLLYILVKRLLKYSALVMLMASVLFAMICILYFAVSDISLGLSMGDETGSGNEHFTNLSIGFESMGNFIGYGFVSPEILGAWNVRLEGWFAQYAFVYGILGMVILASIHYLPIVKAVRNRDVDGFVVVFLMVLSASFFPVYTFQLALFLYLYLLAYLTFKRGVNNE